MPDAKIATYPPLDTLKRVADDVWIVDGPVIRFGLPWPKFTFSTRMTVIRLTGRALFVHSPTPLTASLRAEIEREGTVRYLLGPNRIHYWWIPEWRAAFPEAKVYLAPRVQEQAKGRIDFDFEPLQGAADYPWHGEIATLPVPGSFMTEIEFFHQASRTLVLTDLISNIEPAKVGRVFWRLLTLVGGISAPYGGLPRDLRLNFTWRHRPELRAAVATMLQWDPERVIFAHGRWYEADGTAALRRAFAWLLRDSQTADVSRAC